MITLMLDSGDEVTVHAEEAVVYISAHNYRLGTGVALATPAEARIITSIIQDASYQAMPKSSLQEPPGW